MSDSLQSHGLQHARLPCPSPTPRACSNPCPFNRWCHPLISYSVITFSSCLLLFPASGSFLMSQLFISGGQSTGASASASVLPMNIQDWFPLELTGLISCTLKCQGPAWGTPPMAKVMRKEAWHKQRRDQASGNPLFPSIYPKTRVCFMLSPITVFLREGVNVQLQGNKNSWAWQECFSLWTPLKVI